MMHELKCGSLLSLSRLLVLDQLDVNYGLNFGFCEEIIMLDNI